jgi:hypothetical protein
MQRVMDVTWFALRATWDELITLSGVGFLWFVISITFPYAVYWLASTFLPLPGVVIGAVLVSLILVSPATASLYGMAHDLVRGRPIQFSQFWGGVRSYRGLSWKVGGVLCLSGLILVVDVVFYLRARHVVFSIIGILGAWALLFWLALQIYVYPLMIAQEDKRIKSILKNAAMLTLAFPFFALGILVVTFLASALSVLLLLILMATVWMPFVAVLNSRALVSSLAQVDRYQEVQAELDADQAESPDRS